MTTLCLEKLGHTYILRYEKGQEDQAVEEIMRMADDQRCYLDWMDAASLSCQVAQTGD